MAPTRNLKANEHGGCGARGRQQDRKRAVPGSDRLWPRAGGAQRTCSARRDRRSPGRPVGEGVRRLGCEDMAKVRDAAIDGLDAAILPDHVCREALELGRLVRVLPTWRGLQGIVHSNLHDTAQTSTGCRCAHRPPSFRVSARRTRQWYLKKFCRVRRHSTCCAPRAFLGWFSTSSCFQALAPLHLQKVSHDISHSGRLADHQVAAAGKHVQLRSGDVLGGKPCSR